MCVPVWSCCMWMRRACVHAPRNIIQHPVLSPPQWQKAINERLCSYLQPSNLGCSARRPRQTLLLPVIDCSATGDDSVTSRWGADPRRCEVWCDQRMRCYNVFPTMAAFWWQRKQTAFTRIWSGAFLHQYLRLNHPCLKIKINFIMSGRINVLLWNTLNLLWVLALCGPQRPLRPSQGDSIDLETRCWQYLSDSTHQITLTDWSRVLYLHSSPPQASYQQNHCSNIHIWPKYLQPAVTEDL